MPLPETIALAVVKKVGSLAGSKVLGKLRERARERQDAQAQQALDDLVRQLAMVIETDLNGAAARVEAILREADPQTEDLLLEHFRSHVQALDPASHPYVARLTAWYLTERRQRDAFFRRVGRMLTDATVEEVEQLHLMFKHAREVIGSGLGVDEGLEIKSGQGKASARVYSRSGGKYLRESVIDVQVDDGIAALRRNLILPRDSTGSSWNLDFEAGIGEILGKLIRVFG